MSSKLPNHLLHPIPKTYFAVHRLPLLLLIFCIMLALNACWGSRDDAAQQSDLPVDQQSSSQSESNGASEQSDEQIVEATPIPTATPIPLSGDLVLWHSWSGADAEALEKVLATTLLAYPELTINTLFVAYNNLAQGYAEAVQNGSGPDLVLMPNWWLGDLAAAGVIAPIDALLPPRALDPYWPETVKNLRRSNQLYGIPAYFEVISLFYNQRLIDNALLPGTTTELLALPQQNPSFGVGLYNSLYFLYWGIPAYGGQLIGADGTILLDQNDGTANFLNWLVQINQRSGSYVDTDYGMLVDRFKKGEFAFFVDGPWSIPELRGALGNDLGVMLLPAGPTGPARPWMSTEGFLFNPNSSQQNKMMAVQLALRLTNAENGTVLAQQASRLPANQWASINGDPLLEGFRRQAGTAHAMPNAAEMAEVWGYGGDMLIKVLNGVADPSTTVIETAALINEANQK